AWLHIGGGCAIPDRLEGVGEILDAHSPSDDGMPGSRPDRRDRDCLPVCLAPRPAELDEVPHGLGLGRRNEAAEPLDAPAVVDRNLALVFDRRAWPLDDPRLFCPRGWSRGR